MLDLESIFGDPEGRPLATGSMPKTSGNDMALVVETDPPVSTLRLLDPTTPADSRFADWVLRPDSNGRLGWEAPDLPEWQRWWARCNFEDLPEPAADFGRLAGGDASPGEPHDCDETVAPDAEHVGHKCPRQRLLWPSQRCEVG